MYDICDLHADVVSKLLEYPDLSWSENDPDESRLDVTTAKLRQGGVAYQVFPLFVPKLLPQTPVTLFQAAERFHAQVAGNPNVKLVRRSGDLPEAKREGKLGAIFSLEGADALQGQLWALRLLYRLGLRLLGPTWNDANWACDGAMEPRGGGFTREGKLLVAECERLGITLDVSHLSERGFWELAERAKRPFIASHSNARALCDHPRNLSDDQIRAIFAADGLVGLTFVPYFVVSQEPAAIDDVLRHVEHVCGLGGAGHLAFGSDFDGIERHVVSLEHPGCYPALADALLKRYEERLVVGMLGQNALRFLTKNLPN